MAGDDQRSFIDLANPERQIVEVSASGWSIQDRAPVLFRRPRGVLSLPTPARGAGLIELRVLLGIEDDATWQLLVAWMLAAMRPRGPYPLLCLHGQQGSAKSTRARILQSLLDPSAADLRAEPRDNQDLIIAATNGWVVALDNLSSIPPWLSDSLCRLASGAGMSKRELYSDNDEIIFKAQRPVILTSIEDVATRGDLLERAIVLTMEPIPEEARLPESRIWAELEHCRASVFAALLDALVGAMKQLPNVKVKGLPRMADFALFAHAVEAHLGWDPGSFAAAYETNRADAVSIALESSPIVPALQKLLMSQNSWSGPACDMFATICDGMSQTVLKSSEWPKNARSLSGKLRRLAPNLPHIGICVNFDNTKRPKMINLVRKEVPSQCRN
jgi:hypothetical protein